MTVAAVVDSSEETAAADLDPAAALRRRHRGTTEDRAAAAVPVPAASDSFGGDGSAARLGCHDGRGRDVDGCGVEKMRSASEGLEDGEVKAANGSDGGGGETEQVMKYGYRASAPAHRRVKESPLSSASIFKQSHAGLFNLCIVVLVAVNSRLIIENLMKYGWLIRSGFWFSSRSLRDWPLLMCCLSLPIFPLAAFAVEKLAQQKYVAEPVTVLLHIIITTVSLLYPVLVILRCNSAVLSGVTLMLFTCIVWLKLLSYAHTNYDMRALVRTVEKGDDLPNASNWEFSYEGNFKNLVYFMLAPTLCYQTSYPRTACVRKAWVARQLIKLIIFTGFMGFIVEQYINPIVQNSQHPLKGDLLYGLERVLKLSLPNLYVWLCMFYCFFHLWLNILAELLRFGDREFYKDWWNAETIEEYWRMWNMYLRIIFLIANKSIRIRLVFCALFVCGKELFLASTDSSIDSQHVEIVPVHKWMVRHIYFPCLRNGIRKDVALLTVFLMSAVFHELCIGVPCHMFKLWAFMGIMLQVPLVVLTNYLQKKFSNTMVGNMVFWLFFCILGQPMCILLYYHDLLNRKGTLD